MQLENILFQSSVQFPTHWKERSDIGRRTIYETIVETRCLQSGQFRMPVPMLSKGF